MRIPDLTRDPTFLEEELAAAIRDGDQDDADALYRLLLHIDPERAVQIMDGPPAVAGDRRAA